MLKKIVVRCIDIYVSTYVRVGKIENVCYILYFDIITNEEVKI